MIRNRLRSDFYPKLLDDRPPVGVERLPCFAYCVPVPGLLSPVAISQQNTTTILQSILVFVDSADVV
jgi:hypothetical protein